MRTRRIAAGPLLAVAGLAAAATGLVLAAEHAGTHHAPGDAASAPVAVPGSSAPSEPTAKPALRVVCFGDSITGHRPGEPYLHAYIKWSDLLGLMLEARLGLGRAVCLNRGYSGDATYRVRPAGPPGAVNRLQGDVLAARAHVAVVLLGGNDPKKTDEDRIRTHEGLRTILSKLKDAGVRTLVLGYHVLPSPEDPTETWHHLDDNNPLIEAEARRLGLPYLDMGPPMEAAARQYPHAELVDPRDGVHLRPRGEMVYARTVFAKLDALGWLRPRTGARPGKPCGP